MATQDTDLGNPINTTIVAGDITFDWNDYENIIVFLIGKLKTIKMSLVPKVGYLPLTIVDPLTLLIEVTGKEAKTLGRGEVLLNIFDDSNGTQSDIVKSTPFGINYIDNQIKSEVV